MDRHIRLTELVEQLPLARSSVYELVKVLGITTAKGPGLSGRGRVAWLSSADAERISAAALQVHRGDVRIADLATDSGGSSSSAVCQTSPILLSAKTKAVLGLDLAKASLPDAIAAMVQAWYEAQDVEDLILANNSTSAEQAAWLTQDEELSKSIIVHHLRCCCKDTHSAARWIPIAYLWHILGYELEKETHLTAPFLKFTCLIFCLAHTDQIIDFDPIKQCIKLLLNDEESKKYTLDKSRNH